MADQQVSSQTWAHKWTFILAAAGSAIGLGNIWKFPFITGIYGGGAFVLVYLLCVAAIGIPIMIAETTLGRHGRQSPVNSFRLLTRESDASPMWGGVAWMGLLSGIFILSFYSVIAGWALIYTWDVAMGAFNGMTGEQVGAAFDTLTSNPMKLTFAHTLFMGMTAFVVARGIHKGLEDSVRVMMPALFVILILMLGYSIVETDSFGEGLSFLFSVDFSKLDSDAILAAMGHAFFTLSIGMGAIMAYGAYMPKNTSIVRTIGIVVFLDTAVALVAGMAIFPIVFANGMEASAGPGLLFVSLTTAFGNMPAGQLFGGMFFLLITLAALSSSISLIEPAVAWATERFGLGRVSATLLFTVLIWALGMGTVFSFNIWSGEEYQLFGMTVFELLDFLTANVMLPVGGLLVAVFAGYVMKRSIIFKELDLPLGQFNLWRALCRVVAPLSVLFVFVMNLYNALI